MVFRSGSELPMQYSNQTAKLFGVDRNGLLRHQSDGPLGNRRGVFDVYIADRLPCHRPDPVSALIEKRLFRCVMKELIRP